MGLCVEGFDESPFFTRLYCTSKAEPSCKVRSRPPLPPQLLLLYRPQLSYPRLQDSWHCQCLSSGQWENPASCTLEKGKAKPSRVLAPCWIDAKEVVDVPAAGRQEDICHDVFQQTPNPLPTIDSSRAEGHRIMLGHPNLFFVPKHYPAQILRFRQNWNTPECLRHITYVSTFLETFLLTKKAAGGTRHSSLFRPRALKLD